MRTSDGTGPSHLNRFNNAGAATAAPVRRADQRTDCSMVPTGRHAQPRPMKPLSAPTRVSAACGFCHTATGQVKVAMVTDHAPLPQESPAPTFSRKHHAPRPAIAPAGGLILEGGAPYTSETPHQARPGLAGRPAHGQDAGPVQAFLRKFPSTRWSSWKTNSPIKKRPITSW